jgi:rare lipoprotein A
MSFRGPIHAGLALMGVCALLASACGHRAARVNAPIAAARIGMTETGTASWYGIPYHGRRAASGEIYDMNQLTAAHRKLPFQTWVEVTNLANGKSVDVRINDRGPFKRGRIIDLSQAAARDIDMLGPGTAKVRVKVIPPPPPAVTADVPRAQAIDLFAVQAGAFADRARAERLSAELGAAFADSRVLPGPRNLWRVIVGREMTQEEANELAMRVREQTGEARVIAEPEPGNRAPDASQAEGAGSSPE